jgi:L-seryl-tRNA(Sec) selenium transferase
MPPPDVAADTGPDTTRDANTDPGSGLDARRAVPRTDAVLADPLLAAALARLGRERVRSAVRAAQNRVRTGELRPGDVAAAAAAALRSPGMRTVINATGTVLHTNLGRAALHPDAIAAVVAAAGPADVEYDLASGQRARRGRWALDALRAALPDAQDVLVVNNGAAALLLAVTALAAGREVVWSRGEMVEIGAGFRLPELVASAGATVREVGTTNRTSAADYTVDERTGCLLKVHPSNFRISGFTAAPSVAALAGLGAPLIVDVGSGLLQPDPLMPDEPDVTSALRAGADLVTASGDKLLGGPQAGIVAGSAALVELLRRHPMARALRVDKLTLAALGATLTARSTPTYDALHADAAELRQRAERIAAQVPGAMVVPADGVVGGGGAPGVLLAGWAVSLDAALAAPLRRGEPAVVGRIAGGRLLLDLRAVPASADEALAGAVLAGTVLAGTVLAAAELAAAELAGLAPTSSTPGPAEPVTAVRPLP